MIDIPQGATFQGRSGYLGVPFMAVGFIAAIYAALHNWAALLFAAPVFAVGLVIFMVRKGTLIDPAGKRFKPYRDFFLFRSGPWIPLDGISSVRVKRERETYANDAYGMMENRTAFWCFNVTLHGSGLVKVLFLKEYYEAGPALALGRQLSGALELPLEDATAAPRVTSRPRR